MTLYYGGAFLRQRRKIKVVELCRRLSDVLAHVIIFCTSSLPLSVIEWK